MLSALVLEGREGVSHGARSRANLSTALAGTNLSLSPRGIGAPSVRVCPSPSLPPLAVMKIPPERFTARTLDFVPLWVSDPDAGTRPFKSLIGLFIAKRARFFCTSSRPPL